MMTKPRVRASNRMGFSFVEITLAVVVACVCAVPILYLISSTRTDTSKAINYLRAMELSNEVIEWASIAPFTTLFPQAGSGFVGLIEGKPEIKTIPSQTWPSLMQQNITHCVLHNGQSFKEQYDKCFFRRDATVEDVGPLIGAAAGKLALVTVTTGWNEGREADDTDRNRMRQITLSGVVFNDADPNY